MSNSGQQHKDSDWFDCIEQKLKEIEDAWRNKK